MRVCGLIVLVSVTRLQYICFFKEKTAYEMRISDWSSDVCSSDLARPLRGLARGVLRQLWHLWCQGRRQRAAHRRRGAARRRPIFAQRRLCTEYPYRRETAGRRALQRTRPASGRVRPADRAAQRRLRSEEHTSELQSLMRISYAVFCLK